MLVDFWIFMEGRFREGRPCFYKLLFPPRYLDHSDVVEASCSLERLYYSLFGLIVLHSNHLIDFPEFLVDLLDNEAIFFIEHLLILLNFNINIFNLIQFLLQNPHIFLIIPRHIGNWIFTGKNPMIFMNSTTIDTIDTK